LIFIRKHDHLKGNLSFYQEVVHFRQEADRPDKAQIVGSILAKVILKIGFAPVKERILRQHVELRISPEKPKDSVDAARVLWNRAQIVIGIVQAIE
jgi:hypothetical protein